MAVRVLIFLEVLLFITTTMAQYDYEGRVTTKRFCGKQLAESLALICDGEYETTHMHTTKRSGTYEYEIATHLTCVCVSGHNYWHTTTANAFRIANDDKCEKYFQPIFVFLFLFSFPSTRIFQICLVLSTFCRRNIQRLCIQWSANRFDGWFAAAIPIVCIPIENRSRTGSRSTHFPHTPWSSRWMLS